MIIAFSGLAVSTPIYAEALKYLYINAGEGNASGGHTALQFGADTFHFQHFDGGIIRLVKHASAHFDYQYRYIENRTFHQVNLELQAAPYRTLQHYFNVLFCKQNKFINQL